MVRYFLFFFVLLVFFSNFLFPQNREEKEWEDFLNTKIPLTNVSPIYQENFHNYGENEINVEKDFLLSRCKYEQIKSLSKLLETFSNIDAILLLKSCKNIDPKNLKKVESIYKQKIYDLIKFPKLELISSEKEDPELNLLHIQILNLWEERVYFYSNFYNPHALSFLAEEKTFTEEINRIVYSDMNQIRRISLLKKMKEDLIRNQKSIYQSFSHSEINPFQAKNLLEENQKVHSDLLSLFTIFLKDSELPTSNKDNLLAWQSCLNELDIKTPNVRLLAFYGFFEDYKRFKMDSYPADSKEVVSIRLFLRKNLYQAHHFSGRINYALNTCRKILKFTTNQ